MSDTGIHVDNLLAANVTSRMTGVSPRDSDTELYIQFLQCILGLDLTGAQMTLMRTVKYESISRQRRKLQEQGKYHGSPEVMRRRRIKGYEMQQVSVRETANGIQRRIEQG